MNTCRVADAFTDNECGAIATHWVGVIRTCGCPSTPRMALCERHATSTNLHGCRHCHAVGTAVKVEPVRIKASA